MVRRLIGVLLGLYLVEAVLIQFAPKLGLPAVRWLSLVHEDVWAGKLWMLATYGGLHDVGGNPLIDIAVFVAFVAGIIALFRSDYGRREPGVSFIATLAGAMALGQLGFGAPMHVAGNVVVLWFFGADFERRWGGSRFATFYLGAIIAGGLLSALVWLWAPSLTGQVVLGASGGSLALVAAFAVYYPDAQVLYGFMVPIKGKHLIVLSFVFDLVNLIGRGEVAIVVHAGGALFGYLLTTGNWRPTKLRRRFGRGPSKPAPHLRIVKSDGDRWIH